MNRLLKRVNSLRKDTNCKRPNFTLCCNYHNLVAVPDETVDATVVVGIGIHLHVPVAVVASDFASFADAVVPPFAVVAEDTVDVAFALASSFAVAVVVAS